MQNEIITGIIFIVLVVFGVYNAFQWLRRMGATAWLAAAGWLIAVPAIASTAFFLTTDPNNRSMPWFWLGALLAAILTATAGVAWRQCVLLCLPWHRMYGVLIAEIAAVVAGVCASVYIGVPAPTDIFTLTAAAAALLLIEAVYP